MNLNLHISERRVILLLFDLLVVCFSAILSFGMWTNQMGIAMNHFLFLSHPELLIVVLSWVCLSGMFGIYDLRVASDARGTIRALFATTGCLLLTYLLAYFLAPPVLLTRRPIVQFFLFSFLSVSLWRLAYIKLTVAGHLSRKIIIVGAGWAGETIARVLKDYSGHAYRVVGFVDDDPSKGCQSIFGFPILGKIHELVELVRIHRVSELTLAITHELSPATFRSILLCQEIGIQVTPMPILYEKITGQTPVQHVGSNWYVALPLDHRQTQVFYRSFKRAFDIFGAAMGLVCLLPVLGVIAAAIKLTSKGSVFYKQPRAGVGGTVFEIIKLRTMVQDAEPDGKVITARHRDPRITWIGKFLRLTALDEMPQLWNVLKGEMSLIGPRPERPDTIRELEQYIPFYRLRHAVKPGIAGWAVIHAGYARSIEDNLSKLQYDLYYIKHQSLGTDLFIFFKAAWMALTFRRGEKFMKAKAIPSHHRPVPKDRRRLQVAEPPKDLVGEEIPSLK